MAVKPFNWNSSLLPLKDTTDDNRQFTASTDPRPIESQAWQVNNGVVTGDGCLLLSIMNPFSLSLAVGMVGEGRAYKYSSMDGERDCAIYANSNLAGIELTFPLK